MQQVFYKAKLSNLTSWSFTYDMLRRHFVFWEHVQAICDDELESMLLHKVQKRMVEGVLKSFMERNALTKQL